MFRRCFIFCDFGHVSACLSSSVLITSFKIKERELSHTHQPFGTCRWQELVLTFVPWEFWLSGCKWHSARRNEAKFHNCKATFSGISASLLQLQSKPLFPLPAFSHRFWPLMSQSGESFQENKPNNCLGKGVDFSHLWKKQLPWIFLTQKGLHSIFSIFPFILDHFVDLATVAQSTLSFHLI